jgi:hypothetical protein
MADDDDGEAVPVRHFEQRGDRGLGGARRVLGLPFEAGER